MKFEDLAYPARKRFYIDVWKPYLKLANEEFKNAFEATLQDLSFRYDFEIKHLSFDPIDIDLTKPKRHADKLPIKYSDWCCPGAPSARQGIAHWWGEWVENPNYKWEDLIFSLRRMLETRLRIPPFVEIQYFGPYFDEFWGDFRPNGVPYILNDKHIELVV